MIINKDVRYKMFSLGLLTLEEYIRNVENITKTIKDGITSYSTILGVMSLHVTEPCKTWYSDTCDSIDILPGVVRYTNGWVGVFKWNSKGNINMVELNRTDEDTVRLQITHRVVYINGEIINARCDDGLLMHIFLSSKNRKNIYYISGNVNDYMVGYLGGEKELVIVQEGVVKRLNNK